MLLSPFSTRQLRNAGCISLMCVISAVTLSSCSKSEQADLKSEQVVELNKPAIVSIRVTNQVDYSYSKPVFGSDRQKALTEGLRAKVNAGELKAYEALEQYYREIFPNLSRYVTPGKKISGEAKVTTTGTGSIVHQDGAILTAAHVVSGKDKAIKRQLFGTALREVTDRNCADEWKSVSEEIRKMIQDRLPEKEFMKICRQGYVEYYVQNIEFDKIQPQVSVLLQPSNPGPGVEAKSFPAEIKKFGEKLPGEDVAVLKISASNLPTIALTDTPAMTGNSVLSIGFPGYTQQIEKRSESKDRQQSDRPVNKIQEPTFTEGKVSAAERDVDGGKVIHANVDINPGNSGGPLFNQKGGVIGVASFISVDDDGKKVGNAGYFVPIAVAKKQLQDVGVTPELGKATQRYQEAIDRFNQKDYSRALSLFKEVRDTNPDFPYIQPKIAKAQEEVDKQTPIWVWALGAIGVTGIAGGGVAAAWWLRRKSKKAAQATEAIDYDQVS